MKIAHVALWVNDLRKMIDFYCCYFNGSAGKIYHNPVKNFESCFVTFESGTSLELMSKTDCELSGNANALTVGLNHLAFSVGSREEVDKLTSHLRDKGFDVKSNPRVTGDGYYESVISDPEGNSVEITV